MSNHKEIEAFLNKELKEKTIKRGAVPIGLQNKFKPADALKVKLKSTDAIEKLKQKKKK